MDPLTHALAGAAVAWAADRGAIGRRALLAGAAAGLLPDLDILIRSTGDPLLAIEHHRGFTHSLVFVPVGGAISVAGCWLLAYLRRVARRAIPRQQPATQQHSNILLAGMLAYLTHPLLDAATTYGTQLFWPFSRLRVGLDIISIIDPLFTVIVLLACIAALRGRARLVHAALGVAVLWLGIGYVQRERASAVQARLAASRGERVTRAAVFPTVGNTIVWRSLYETNGVLRMDRIRVPWLGKSGYAPGVSVPRASEPEGDVRALRDFTRFAWFSDGWVARDPADPTVIGDARYSLHANRYRPVWGIRLNPTRWVDRSRERMAGLRMKD